MKLTKVNETHRNMETTVYPTITNFGPPSRRPGRMLVKPLSEARAAYVGHRVQRYHGRRGQKLADWMKPTYAGVSAGRRQCT
jgi:hypothetical protein